ncbi:MAG: glycosyltransferase family 2 protein [Parafilimonas sp.]
MQVLPKVSVLIPTYNYAHFLDESIQSVLNQTFTDFELIIVDNCSTDHTAEVVQKYLIDKRISYYKNSTNIGMIPNYNKCLEYAKAEYIKYLCGDDKFHPQLLEKFVPVMDEYPNVYIVTSNSEMFGSRTKKREAPFKYLQEGKKVIYESLKEGRGNWIGEPTVVMFRKSALKVGKFATDPNLSGLNDWEMWLRMLTVGDCYIIPETLSYFRAHTSQFSAKNLNNFNFTFQDYYFYKLIETKNVYNIDLSKISIDKIVKKRATYCSHIMYKILPELYKKKSRQIFRRAFKIAYSEGVIGKEFFLELFNVFKRNTVGKVFK